LCALTANQCATGSSARAGKTADELIENARLKFFAANVIEKKKRARAERSNIVYAVIHKIGANGVVLVRRECDFQFCADAINARDQDRIAHSGKLCSKQTTEATDFSERLRPVRLSNESLNSALKPVAKIDIYARARVGFSFSRRSHSPNL